MTQTDLFGEIPTRDHAKARRDLAVMRGTERADRARKDWTDNAVRMLEAWAAGRGPFLAEDFREAMAGKIPKPPDGRHWGGVLTAARLRGSITQVGAARARSSNLGLKPQWQAK
jgi:hypothetical protein